tara:strand:- start:15649 stop:16485 length:837 start_codon:yes stop_codon:yes gene_type:complete
MVKENNTEVETASTIVVSNDDRQYWKEEEEKILEEWADKAQCFEWMHNKTHNIYKKKNGYYTVPVIIISTFTGTANFAQERIPEDYVSMYVMIIGSLNILAGILTTIYQYLKISELNESNRVAYLSWGKFYRDVKTELSKHPLDRMRPKELLKLSKNEYDRLVEISPPIPQKIIDNFNAKINKETSDNLRKPEVCDIITATKSYEMTDLERNELRSFFNKKNQQSGVLEVIKDERLENFKKTFFEVNNRYPTEDEVKDLFYSLYTKTKSISSSSVTVI